MSFRRLGWKSGWNGKAAALAVMGFALSMAGCGSSADNASVSYGTISTVAGTGIFGSSGDGGPATSARIYQPMGLAFDAAGDLYVTDAAENVVRKIAAGSGIISTFAGVPSSLLGGYAGNGGPATSALFYGPFGIALDASGNVSIADEANNVIRRVSIQTGLISALAGNGTLYGTPSGTYSGDGGPALAAGIDHPWAIAYDAAGNLYIADTYNSVVRKVSVTTGIITTIAGNGTRGSGGDGGPATSAQLYHPQGLAFDASGNLYIADQANNTIRKVNLSTGVISKIAGVDGGDGTGIRSGDGGPATAASLAEPFGMVFDAAGNLLFADQSNNVVRRVNMSTGIIQTIVGSTQGFGGDGGPSNAAQVNNPMGLALDASGNLYIADSVNGRIRKVTVTH